MEYQGQWVYVFVNVIDIAQKALIKNSTNFHSHKWCGRIPSSVILAIFL